MLKINVILVLFILFSMAIYSFRNVPNYDIVENKEEIKKISEMAVVEKKDNESLFSINLLNHSDPNLENESNLDNQKSKLIEKENNCLKIRLFSNSSKFIEDLEFLHKSKETDTSEITNLKIKFKQEMICNYKSINGQDLLNHIKVAFDLEESIVLPEEYNKILERQELVFSPKPIPRPLGEILSFILSACQLSYTFKENKLIIVQARIEEKKNLPDPNCLNKK